jgi:phosphoribosylformylglycinamidine synthase
MKARVTVMLKSGVLDPQGKAIGQSLNRLGFSNVGDVRQGKVIEIELDDGHRAPISWSRCARSLANTVIENCDRVEGSGIRRIRTIWEIGRGRMGEEVLGGAERLDRAALEEWVKKLPGVKADDAPISVLSVLCLAFLLCRLLPSRMRSRSPTTAERAPAAAARFA